VGRDANGMLLSIYTPKINVSKEGLDVVTAGLGDLVEIGRAGTLKFEASYSDLLKHTYQQYAGDQIIDLLRNPTWSTDFKSKLIASVTWSAGSWQSTVYVNRVGRSPNFLATSNGYGTPGSGTLSPWTLCNASVRYQWNSNLQLFLAIDNAFNAMPPADHSYAGIYFQPYNSTNYNDYGRLFYLEASYKFGK
jgi:iron complex outermembrane receptor protein